MPKQIDGQWQLYSEGHWKPMHGFMQNVLNREYGHGDEHLEKPGVFYRFPVPDCPDSVYKVNLETLWQRRIYKPTQKTVKWCKVRWTSDLQE